MKIIKTHQDDYLGIFSSQKVNSLFAVSVFVTGVWDVLM